MRGTSSVRWLSFVAQQAYGVLYHAYVYVLCFVPMSVHLGLSLCLWMRMSMSLSVSVLARVGGRVPVRPVRATSPHRAETTHCPLQVHTTPSFPPQAQSENHHPPPPLKHRGLRGEEGGARHPPGCTVEALWCQTLGC